MLINLFIMLSFCIVSVSEVLLVCFYISLAMLDL